MIPRNFRARLMPGSFYLELAQFEIVACVRQLFPKAKDSIHANGVHDVPRE
jgi:hypothetical protein